MNHILFLQTNQDRYKDLDIDLNLHQNANHQAKTANFSDGRRIFLPQPDQFIEEKLADRFGVGGQVVAVDHLENLVRHRAGQRVAAER